MKSAWILTALLLPPGLPFQPALPSGKSDPALKKEFEKLASQNDTPGLGKLAKSRTDDTVAWIVETCETLANRSDPDAEAFAQILRDAWKAGIGSEFADREYEGMKNLGANRRDRNDLKDRFDASEKELERNLEQKDDLAFQNVLDEMEVVAPGLEQVGDWYRASEAWILSARASDASSRGDAADLHKTYLAYARAVEARDKMDLKDSVYEEIAKRKAELLAAGHDKKQEPAARPSEPAGGGGAAGAGGSAGAPVQPPSEAGAPITAATTFEPLPAIDAYARPNFMVDEIYLLWGGLGLLGKGTSATFSRFGEAPSVVRVGASDLRIDTDGDGQGDEKLVLTGNPVLVKMTIGKAEKARPWAFLAQIGNEKDQYQKVAVNNAPNDKNYTVYTLAAASIVANIGGTPVRVIDEDLDGIYGNVPQIWGEIGLTKDVFQPEMDSIVIGASKRARPWSELQEIGGKWYKLAPGPAGKEIQATPVSVDTGVLKLGFKGPIAPAWVVVQLQGPDGKNTFFDLVEGGAKGVTVPAGNYKLYFGEMRKGKKNQTQKTLILPGKKTPAVEVPRGGTATMTLGAPFGFEFRVAVEGDKLLVPGGSVVITGSQDERYERAWNCVARPEVFWRKKGTKTSNNGGKMAPFQNVDDFAKGYDIAWFPTDLVVPLKNDKDPVEVQLVDKKHDLFGKIESGWQE